MLLTPDGKVIRTPERRPITLDKLKRFMEFEQILRECGWSLVCRKCANFVAGDNAVNDTRLSVKCSCKEYVFDAGAN